MPAGAGDAARCGRRQTLWLLRSPKQELFAFRITVHTRRSPSYTAAARWRLFIVSLLLLRPALGLRTVDETGMRVRRVGRDLTIMAVSTGVAASRYTAAPGPLIVVSSRCGSMEGEGGGRPHPDIRRPPMEGESDMIDITQGIKRARRPLVHGRLWWHRAHIRLAAQHSAAGDGDSGTSYPRAEPGAEPARLPSARHPPARERRVLDAVLRRVEV